MVDPYFNGRKNGSNSSCCLVYMNFCLSDKNLSMKYLSHMFKQLNFNIFQVINKLYIEIFI